MQGQIIKLHDEIGYGIIAADNGRRYRFAKSEVVNAEYAAIGQSVDFELRSMSGPAEIIVLDGSPWTTFASRV